MEIKTTCPLGHECERAEAGTLLRCAWYVLLRGKNPQSEQEIDEWGCAMGWLPILLVENAQRIRSVAAATESTRNEIVKSFDVLTMGIASAARGVAKPRSGLARFADKLIGW